jgi:hypothetical protein
MFIPRHPVIENQFCSYGAQTATGSAGVGGVVCYAGSVLYLYAAATNEEPVVYKMAHGTAATDVPFGFSMQKVKTGYHQVHPTGYFMPGDFGSSDVVAQADYNVSGAITGTKAAPVGVAHLGIWDTVHYTCKMTASVIDSGYNMKPGMALYPAASEAKVTNNSSASDGSTDAATGAACNNFTSSIVARVVKGASTAKAQANINNTTLYPIRIKLLV